MAVTLVQELVTKFSFVGDSSPLRKYSADLKGSVRLLGASAAALQAATIAFGYWADGVLTGVDALGRLSRQTRVAVSDIQRLQYIAGQTGGSVESVASTLIAVNRAIGAAALRGSEDFARLGISVRDSTGHVKTATQVIGEVQRRFTQMRLSLPEQDVLASAIGIDAEFLNSMRKAGDQMGALSQRAKQLGVLTAQQTSQAEKYKAATNELWFGLNSLKQLIAVGVAPELRRMASDFTELLLRNKDWIVAGARKTVHWVGNILTAVKNLTDAWPLLLAGYAGWKLATLGLTGALTAANLPLVIITAAITGLLVVLEDLIVGFRGGKSVIVDFFKDTFNVDIVDAMRSAVSQLNGELKLLTGWIKTAWSYWTSFTTGVWNIGAAIAGFFNPVGTAFGSPGSGVLTAGTSAFIPPTRNSTSNNTSNVAQSVQIDVIADDPRAVAEAVQNLLQGQIDNANTQLMPGGR